MAAIIRFDLDILKMTVQGGGCTAVLSAKCDTNPSTKPEKGLLL